MKFNVHLNKPLALCHCRDKIVKRDEFFKIGRCCVWDIYVVNVFIAKLSTCCSLVLFTMWADLLVLVLS